MSDNQSEGEGDFTNETKYKQYSASVERALKSFELSTEWHDLISCLARINKVFLAYKQYPVVPIQLTVCKRLSQCLHPNLPSGVHLKTLSVYTAIFDRIGSKRLASNLLLYSSALFPLLGYASMSVRPRLLDIYEQHYIPLGDQLMPALHGFVLGLLPGLEDESEHTDRICRLLDAICSVTDESAFFCALWRCVLGSPDVRLPAVSFVLSKLNKKLTAEDQVYCLGGHLPLVVSSLCSALNDKNVLVGRAALDIVTILFPLHQSFLVPADLTTILSAALQTLLKRDVSLNRRLYAWLLGTSVDKSQLANRLHPLKSISPSGHERQLTDADMSKPSQSCPEPYLEAFSKEYLIGALKMIITQASLSAKHGLYKADCILPYRLIRALVDKPELALPVLNEILLDLLCCLKQQITDLGGLASVQAKGGGKQSKSSRGVLLTDDSSTKKPSKKGALKSEILQSSNLFFNSLESDVLWKWANDFLKDSFDRLGVGTDTTTSDHGNETKLEMSPQHAARERDRGEEGASHDTPTSSSPTSDLVEGHGSQLAEKQDQVEKEQSVVEGGRKASLRTHANSVVSSSAVSSCAERQDLSFTIDLIKFLIDSLPLESIENTHKRHLPQLLLLLFSELAQKEARLSIRQLQTCFSLASHVVNEILKFSLSQSNSLASTPSTPLPRTPTDSPGLSRAAAQRQLSEDLLTRQFEELKSLVAITYLEFFSTFLNNRVLNQQVVIGEEVAGGHLFKAVFSGACELLLHSARLTTEMASIGNGHEDTPVWLRRLMSVCLLKPAEFPHHQHVIFVSLESLLTLLEWQLAPYPNQGMVDGGAVNFFSKEALNHVLLNAHFEKSVSEFLWSCLAPGSAQLHSEAAVLMSWMNSLFSPSSVCEKVILECFTSQGMVAYQSFAVLWQFSPSTLRHISPRPFNKAILRMLEGLQSQDAAVRHFVGSWVRHATSREEGAAKLLQPLLRILAEAEPLRRSDMNKCLFSDYEVRLSRDEAAKDPAYAKYYYASLGISDPEEALKTNQYKEGVVHYIQVFDVNQVLYSLSLLLSAISVEPTSIVGCMSGIVVESSSYLNLASSGQSNLPLDSDSTTPSGIKDSRPAHEDSGQLQPGSSRKSVLELLLTSCIRFLQSEFHESLEVSLEDLLDHNRVKGLCAELLEVVHTEFVHILAKAHVAASDNGRLAATTSDKCSVVPDRGANIANSGYVTALVTLCDVQKSTLLLLASIVQEIRELERADLLERVDPPQRKVANCNGRVGSGLWQKLLTRHRESGRSRSSSIQVSDPIVSLSSLFVHLLKLIQSLITLDSQCHICAKLSGSKSSASTPFPLPGSLSSVTAGVKLSNGHDLPPVLSGITTASQPFFQLLLLDILSDVSLNRLHVLVLAMLTTTLPNLIGHQVDELAPKILKQLCQNLEQPKGAEKLHDTGAPHRKGKHPSSSKEQSHFGPNTLSYLESAVTVILWCLFGEKNGGYAHPSERGGPSSLSVYGCPQQAVNLFWRLTSVVDRDESNHTLTPTLKQPSTIAWLLGVFSQKGGVAESGGGGVGGERDGGNTLCSGLVGAGSTGLTSLVGQYVIMLLPAVYQVIADLWRVSGSAHNPTHSHSSGPAEAVGSGMSLPVAAASTEAIVLSLFDKITARKSKTECGEVQRLVSQLLCPLAEREPTAFFSSISHVWLEWNLETQARPSKKLNKRKDTFIEILHRIQVLPLERVVSCVQETLSEIARLEDLESGVLRQKYLLHFLYKYISSGLQSSEELGECRTVLVSFLKDCYTLCYTPRPECLTNNCHILCMLTSILHVFVCRVPAPDPKKQKKERKDLQDVTHKLCEAMSTTANVGLNQSDYVTINRVESSSSCPSSSAESNSLTSRDLPPSGGRTDNEQLVAATPSQEETTSQVEGDKGRQPGETSDLQDRKTGSVVENAVLATPHGHVTGESVSAKDIDKGEREIPSLTKERSVAGTMATSGSELQLPAKQALAVLSNVLSHFIDCVFDGTERDKVISLLKSVMHNVWPHLHNHSFEFRPCFMHAVKLLSSLSGFQVTRKAWRKEAFDLFLDTSFFVVEMEALREWKVVIDNLMTQDQVTFRDLLTRLNPSATMGVVNIFSSLEQEVVTGARLVKRMSFVLFSGETDQYVSFLPDIQEKLTEYLKVLRYPAICSEVLLAFRVLLLKFSPPHVLAFWPAIVAELLSLLGRLETDLRTELSEHVVPPPARLQLYLSACKLLDTAVALPPETLPHFQLLQWGFTSHRAYTDTEALIVTRLCRQYQAVESEGSGLPSTAAAGGFPRLQKNSISSLKELKPLFDGLLHKNRSSIVSNHHHLHSTLFNSKSSLPLNQTAAVAASAYGGLVTSAQLEARLTAVENLLLFDFLEV